MIQINRVSRSVYRQKVAVYRLLAVVLLLASLLSLSAGAFAQAPAPADVEALPQNTLSGVVSLEGGGFPAQAQVLAWRLARHPLAVVNPASGAYSLALWEGPWAVTVVPAQPTTFSPEWVYTGGVQWVLFSANPDPANPNQILNLAVTPATGSISGSLLAPGGGTNFAAPNRVWVRAQNQEGQGNTVQVNEATGAFSVKVLPGNTLLRFEFENPAWAAPVDLSGAVWAVEDGGAAAVGTIQLISRDARIQGVVTDQAGDPVVGLPVQAWRLDGALAARTLTDLSGAYTLAAIEGVWMVQVNPLAVSPYVPAQPPQRVTLASPMASATQDLGVLAADVTVNGTLVNAVGTPISALNGRVVALYQDGTRWPQFGQGAPVQNGIFTLKLSSSLTSHYRLRVALPDQAGYTAASVVDLTVAAGQTYPVTIPVAANNSTISGQFLNRLDLTPKLGLPGAIYAVSNSGALKRAKVNPLTGGYSFDAAALDTSGQGGTTWWLKAFVDPTTGWVVQQPRLAKVFLPYNNGSGADVTADFLVAQVNAAIGGVVTGPGGAPMPGVRVSVRELGASAAAAFQRWTYTNASGAYLLRVPAGQYRVRADERNLIAPLPVDVTVAAGERGRADLQFRAKNATVSGTVVYAGSAHVAELRAFSSSGAHLAGRTDLAGSWSLDLRAGETWHIQAVAEEGTQFLKSERIHLQVHPGTDPNSYQLTLLASDTLPEAVVFNFDAALDQVLTLSNGSQVVIPGGALAPSGLVSVAAHPLIDLADDAGVTPVSFGYRLLAFDETFAPILRFNAPVTLLIPFSAAQLAALGVTPEQLVPAYWDPSTSSWKAVPGFSVTVSPDGSGQVSISLEHFTDYGLLTDAYSYRTSVPMIAR